MIQVHEKAGQDTIAANIALSPVFLVKIPYHYAIDKNKSKVYNGKVFHSKLCKYEVCMLIISVTHEIFSQRGLKKLFSAK